MLLNIANNDGLSSSLFALAEHKAIWPDVHHIDRIKCITSTLDDLLALLPSPDALVLDTQGAELMILAGGEYTLNRVRAIKAEAADFKAYEGGCTDRELIDFLNARAFQLIERRRFVDHPAGGGYFDLVFRRTGAGTNGGLAQ
jgi:hypothetical protein